MRTYATDVSAGSFVEIRRLWSEENLKIAFAKTLTTESLPDRTNTVAFMDGPLVLAGLTAEERTLHGDVAHLDTLLKQDQERHHGWWNTGSYRAVNQDVGMRFVPLNDIVDETYTIYFPVVS